MAQYRARTGFGDGGNRVFLLPIGGFSFITVYVNGVEIFWGIDYDILSGSGEYGMDLLVFRTAPTDGYPIEIEWTDHSSYIHTVESLRITMGVQG